MAFYLNVSIHVKQLLDGCPSILVNSGNLATSCVNFHSSQFENGQRYAGVFSA